MMGRLADLAGPTAYPGETPDALVRNDVGKPRPRRDYTTAPQEAAEIFRWVATPLFVLVGDQTSSEDGLLAELGWSPEKPFAAGELELRYRWDAIWKLERANMAAQQIQKSLRTYTKDQDWNWQSLVLPSGEAFGKHSRRYADYPGIGEINPGVKDWKNKEWSGMETHDAYNPHADKPYAHDPKNPEVQGPGEGLVDELYSCSDCGQPCGSEDEFRQHVLRYHVHKDHHHQEDPGPVVDLDDALPAGWNEVLMDQTDQRAASRLTIAMQKIAVGQQPLIQGPIPFIYDIQQDRIYVGHPGERHSDIQGRFTPGGIVEGQYDPKGNVQIRTDTDMPYTIRHMAQLWYALHPELEMKGIYLLSGDQKHKMASANIGHKVRNLLATEPAAYSAYKALSEFGKVYAVGGAVRDVILGKIPKDIDLLVQGIKEEDVQNILSRLPGRVDVTGQHFGVFRYRDPDGNEVEVALPRLESSSGDGHRDFDVQADPFLSVEQDLGRRDFTANAMAVDLSSGELIDPHHGSEDIKRGSLELVSDKAFEEDPLRILRAMVAISRHQLIPTKEVLESIHKNSYRLQNLPAERIQQELDKMMTGDDPALAISLLEDTGVFKDILPEYQKTIGFDQRNRNHFEPLHDHLKTVLRKTVEQSRDPDLRWAAFLHDIGKPRSLWLDEEGNGHYYENEHGHGANHDELGSKMSREALERLKFPNNRTDRIEHLIKSHMFPRFENERGARKFIQRVGDEHADDLLRLRASDVSGRDARRDDVGLMTEMVNRVRQTGQPTGVSSLAINGNDLIQAGFQPGPQMGATLQYLADQVVENPELNTPETLLQMASESWDDTKTSNILDPIQTTLDPDVFDAPQSPEPKVKRRIVKWVREFVSASLMEAGWPDPSKYLNIILTGSLTTYQWADHSDFDCSLWIDVERFPEWVRADLIALMIEKCDGVVVPGTTHPIQCFVVDPIRNTREDLYQPGLRSAYDLDSSVWIVPPEHREVDINTLYRGAVAYAKTVTEKMKLLLKYDSYAVKTYWDFLHKQRMREMRAGKGDFSESNIVYKMLSNEGLFPFVAEATGEHIA